MFNILKKVSTLLLATSLLVAPAWGASTDSCYDTDAVIMLHMNGADASTTFTDERGHSFTANGNVQIDTAQSVFGGASGLFDGTDDFLEAADSDDWDLAAGEWTIDFRVMYHTTTSSRTVIAQWENTGTVPDTRNFWIGQLSSTQSMLAWSTTGQNVSTKIIAWTPTVDTWYHVAWVRTGDIVRFFVDGTQTGTDAAVAVTFFNPSSSTMGIGTITTTGEQDMDGWIDELRVVRGVAVWTSNFTPPSAEYVACASVKTVNGLAIASVKTVNGLAEASIKTINGTTN